MIIMIFLTLLDQTWKKGRNGLWKLFVQSMILLPKNQYLRCPKPQRKDRLPIPQRKGSLFSLSFWGKNYVWWICWSSGWHNLPMLRWLLRLRALPALWTCSYKDSMPDSTKPAIKTLEKTKVGWEKSLMGKKSAHPNFTHFFGGGISQHGDFPKPFVGSSGFVAQAADSWRTAPQNARPHGASLEPWRAGNVLMQNGNQKDLVEKKENNHLNIWNRFDITSTQIIYNL